MMNKAAWAFFLIALFSACQPKAVTPEKVCEEALKYIFSKNIDEPGIYRYFHFPMFFIDEVIYNPADLKAYLIEVPEEAKNEISQTGEFSLLEMRPVDDALLGEMDNETELTFLREYPENDNLLFILLNHSSGNRFRIIFDGNPGKIILLTD